MNSIINNTETASDVNGPFSFFEWLKENTSITPDVNIQFIEYKKYVLDWTVKRDLSKKESQETLNALYVQILREIVVSYSTEEERRFITNADLSNSSDVEIILPFFINKLKQICLYYSTARESIKNVPIQYSSRGSNFGLEKIVKDMVYTTAELDLSFDNKTCFFPPISAISKDFSVQIEELYDTTASYYNKFDNSATLILPVSGTNIIYPELYINFKNAVVEAIKQYSFVIDSLSNFSINPLLSGTEYNYLKNRDFVNYIQNNLTENLKINLLRKLAPKYLANDFYYLSTGNSITNIVSGVLFSVAPLSGAPTLNLLNRNNPTIASVPNTNALYPDYELGRFFLPKHQGLLTFITPAKRYEIDTTKLESNKIYAFPDPNVVGNVTYNSEHMNEVPLIYVIDVTWNKTGHSNQFKFGDVFSTPYYSQYYGYQSREQDLRISTSGISKIQDNVDFWEDLKKDKWKNSDVWPSINTVNNLPNNERQKSLFINNDTPVYWFSDIYNNDFCITKQIDTLKTINVTLTSQGGIPGQNTIVASTTANYFENSIFNIKNNLIGTLYFRDSIGGKTLLGIDALSSVFFKYPENIINEIKNGIIYFAIYRNTFVIETSGHVIVDSYEYNFDTQRNISNTPQGIFYAKFNLNNRLERFAGEWFSEKDNKLYLCFLVLDPRLSRSNYKILYPKIHAIDLSTLSNNVVFPDPDLSLVNTYSLSVNAANPPQININKIDGISFEFLQKSNVFNVSYLGKNLNGLPLLVNEQIYKNDPFYYSYLPQIFQPFFYLVDTNYFTPNLPFFVKYVGSTSGLIGSHVVTEGNFNVNNFSLSGVNYMYCDGIKPLQLNTTGTFIVQFDWQVYNEVTMFLGCSSYTLRNTDFNLLWDVNTLKTTTLIKNKPHVISFNKKITNEDINVTILRLQDSPALIKFDITSSTPGFTGLLCDSSNSIYREITVTKLGDGIGTVLSDPFCIDCNNKCSEFFGYNTTVTFIASADYWSRFIRWGGGPCEGLTTDCIFEVTTAFDLKAYFDKLPTANIIVRTPAGRVFSQDLRININAGDGSSGPISTDIIYPLGAFITLSAVTPISGWAMYGFNGGACNGVVGDRCTFAVTQPMIIDARYIRYYEYPLRISVTSFNFTQSSSKDFIRIGGDNVDDGLPSQNKFFYQYDCNSSCTFILTGTNTSRYGNQTATLCARPSPGRRLKYWLGDTDCNQEEYVVDATVRQAGSQSTVTQWTSVVFAEPTDTVNTGYVCNLTMDRPRDVTGVFDIGYYTLTLITSGDGIGEIFSFPGVTMNNPPVLFFKDRVESGTITKYAVISGTTLTVACSAIRGSSFLNLSSRYFEPVDGVSSRQVIFDNDVTVIAMLSATEFYTLTIVNNNTTCGILITSFPVGRFFQTIGCPSTCVATYAEGRRINIEPVSANNSCILHYFIADPIVGGGGLKFRYQAGPGIILSESAGDFELGDTIAISNPSLSIAPGGAPYITSSSIIVTPEAFVILTDNLTVTAISASPF